MMARSVALQVREIAFSVARKSIFGIGRKRLPKTTEKTLFSKGVHHGFFEIRRKNSEFLKKKIFFLILLRFLLIADF